MSFSARRMAPSAPPRPASDPRHRRFPESDIVRQLALDGWADEIGAGRDVEALEGGARALAVAVAAGVGCARPSPGRRLFDYAEVQHVLDWLAETGQDPLWSDRAARAREAHVAFSPSADRPELHGGGEPPPIRFHVLFERTFDLHRFGRGSAERTQVVVATS